MFSLFSEPIVVGIAVLVLAIVIVAVIVIRRYRIADPDEAIIVTGRKGKTTQDLSGQKVVTGGGVFVLPFVQKSYRLSLKSRQLAITTNAQTTNGITIEARAVAVVKVGGTEELIRAAAQRFLNQQDEIESSTQEVLSGSLRGIIGGLTVESIIRDRAALASAVLSAAEDALTKQGLVVDTLQIQEIKDNTNYINNLGRPEAAKVLRLAEVADVEAQLAANEARITADQTILERNRELKIREAEIREETDKATAVAEAAKPREDAIQRQKIVEAEEITAQKEASLKEQRLNAEIRKVADAEAYRIETIAKAEAESVAQTAEGQARADVAKATAEKQRRELAAEAAEREGQAEKVSRTALADAVRAEGIAEADAIAAKGTAEADAIAARADALADQSQAVLAQEAMHILPLIARELAAGYGSIDNMTIVSSDGSNKVTSDMVGNIAGVTTMLKDATGIDVAGLINGAVTGQATGQALGAELGKARRSKQEAYVPKFTPTIVKEVKAEEAKPSKTTRIAAPEKVQVEEVAVVPEETTPFSGPTAAEKLAARNKAYTDNFNSVGGFTGPAIDTGRISDKANEVNEALLVFSNKQFDKVEKTLEAASKRGVRISQVVDANNLTKLGELIGKLREAGIFEEAAFQNKYPKIYDLFEW